MSDGEKKNRRSTREIPPLTEEESAMKLERAMLSRELHLEVIGKACEGFSNDEIGVMISGGVDSTCITASLLALGYKPKTFTMRIADNRNEKAKDGISRDVLVSRELADKWGLELVEVMVEDDKQDFAESALSMAYDYTFLTSQPDFEVGYLYRQTFKVAQTHGIKLLFNGLDPGLYPHHNEAMLKRGFYGKAELPELNAILVDGYDSTSIEQITAFSQMAWKEFGINAVSPLMYIGPMLPYLNTPFRVINHPEMKSVTTLGFRQELGETKIYPSSMQKGNSGADLMFERLGKNNEFMAEIMGVSPSETSSTKYINYIRKERNSAMEEDGIDAGDSTRRFGNVSNGKMWLWPMFLANVYGESLEPFINGHLRYKVPYPINPDGSPKLDVQEIESAKTSMFDLFDIEETPTRAVNARGEECHGDPKDERTDCFGRFLNEGWSASCPRARAGLCTISKTPVEDRGFEVEACAFTALNVQAWLNRSELTIELLGGTVNARLLQSWRKKVVDHYKEIETLRSETERLKDAIEEQERDLKSDPKLHAMPWIFDYDGVSPLGE